MCLKCLLASQTCPDSPIKHFIIWPLLFLFKPFSLHFIILHLEGPYAEPPNFLQLCFMFLNESPHRAVQVISLYLIIVIGHLSSMLQFISCHTTAIHFFKTIYQILLPRSLVQICYNYEKKLPCTLHIRATLETLYFPQLIHSIVRSRKKMYTYFPMMKLLTKCTSAWIKV